MTRILIHIHLYYTDLWPELLKILSNFEEYNPEVYLTITSPDFSEKIINDYPAAKVIVVENKGFDVWPFIHVINQVNLDIFDFVVKLHSKRNLPLGSLVNGFNVSGPKWRNLLLAPFKNKKNLNATISLLEKNNQIGSLCSPELLTSYKNDNKRITETLYNYFPNFSNLNYKFVAGTMFIVRSSILKEIQKLNINEHYFEKSDRKNKNSKAYILERVLGIINYTQGLKIETTIYGNKYLQAYFILKKIIFITLRFIYRRKITENNKLVAKIFKIPFLNMKIK